MMPGNLVLWDNEFWVVAEVDDAKNPTECLLISAIRPNQVAHVSETEPENRFRRIGSVNVVAPCMAEYIRERIMKPFQEIDKQPRNIDEE